MYLMDVLRDVGELTFRPRELKFRKVQTMLYHFGYKLVNSKGSHFRFKKEGFPSITVVVHDKKVKKWYVKAMAKILISQLPLTP